MRLLVMLLLAACQPTEGRMNAEALAPAVERGADPTRGGLRGLLLARHPDDLPQRQAIDAHGGPDALITLAGADPELMVRARALDRLGLYDLDPVAAYLLGVVSDEGAISSLRAAAIVGLGRMDLSRRGVIREALIGVARGADLRLALESVGVLSDVPEADAALAAIAADPGRPSAVREAAAP